MPRTYHKVGSLYYPQSAVIDAEAFLKINGGNAMAADIRLGNKDITEWGVGGKRLSFQSSFPGSPTIGDIHWWSHADGKAWYWWDGTYWRSAQEYCLEWSMANSGPYTGAQGEVYGGVKRVTSSTEGHHFESDIWVTRYEVDTDASVGTIPGINQILRFTIGGTTVDKTFSGYHSNGKIGNVLLTTDAAGMFVRYIYSPIDQTPGKVSGRTYYNRIGA